MVVGVLLSEEMTWAGAEGEIAIIRRGVAGSVVTRSISAGLSSNDETVKAHLQLWEAYSTVSADER